MPFLDIFLISLIFLQEHLFDLERELGKEGVALYVLYPDESGKWRIQAVPESSESFQSRKALPAEWRGLRDDALSQKTGVPGCIFVHASGFIGGQDQRYSLLVNVIDKPHRCSNRGIRASACPSGTSDVKSSFNISCRMYMVCRDYTNEPVGFKSSWIVSSGSLSDSNYERR